MRIKISILIATIVLFSGIDVVAGDFTDNGDGTVTDSRTGLMWPKDATGVGYVEIDAYPARLQAYSGRNVE